MSLMALGLSALLSQLRVKQDELEASNQCLDKLNRELEARVDQRTAELKSLNAQLEELVLTDTLTGLSNRRASFDPAHKAIAQSKRRDRPLALIVLDIDHFKAINDRCGRLPGDAVLQQAAEVIRPAIRPGDTAVRYGGREFVIVAPDTDEQGAEELAERIRQALHSEQIKIDQGVSSITASLGGRAMPRG